MYWSLPHRRPHFINQHEQREMEMEMCSPSESRLVKTACCESWLFMLQVEVDLGRRESVSIEWRVQIH